MSSLRLVLAPYVKIGIQQGVLYVGFGSIQFLVRDTELVEPTIRLLHTWTNPSNVERMRELFANEIQNLHGFTRVFETIVTGSYLVQEDQIGNDRYSRHMRHYALSGADPHDVQKRLASSHVVVLGCGGIGSVVSLNLATAGVGALHLVDEDEVELSNLTRQHLFRESDVGRRKIDVLKESLSSRNSNTRITADALRVNVIEDLDALPDTDLIVLSADSQGLLWKVNAYCVTTSTPFLNVSYIEDIAVWGPFVVPGETGCWACARVIADQKASNPDIDRQLAEINARYQPPSFGPINTLASALASLDIIKFLGGYGNVATTNKRVGLWTHELRLETQSFTRNPHCIVCRKNS